MLPTLNKNYLLTYIRTKQCFYAEIVTDTTTRNKEHKDTQ